MSNYRNKYQNFYLDKKGSYVPVGSVVPVLADFYSRNSDIANLDPGLPIRPQIQSPHHSYFGFLYCDGSLYNIRDYPGLYEIIGNTYLQTDDIRNGYSPANVSSNGSILRSLFDGNDFYLVFSQDQTLTQNSKNSGQSFVKRPFPYGANLRITNLGNFPPGLLILNNNYILDAPTTNNISVSSTEFLYKVSEVSGAGITQSTYTLQWSSLLNYPTFRVTKNYSVSDFPYIVGKFRVPDYRQRKLIGYSESGIAGAGSSTIESRSNANVGAIGGRWYISTETIADPSFYVVGDVKTSGYSDISTTVSSNLIGNVSFKIGPIGGYRLVRPVTHSHILLNAEPNEGTENATSFNEVDKYSVAYQKIAGNIIEFVPGESPASIRPTAALGVSDTVTDGSPLEHSHGIIGRRLTSTSVSTYGNTNGIGEFVVTNGVTNYRSTETPPIPIAGNLTYSAVTGFVSVNTTVPHGLTAGSVITISNATPAAFNGQFEVSATALAGTFFQYIPLSAPNPATSSGAVILRSANGFFDTRTITRSPRMWVVDNDTVIGGKPVIIENPASFLALDPPYELNTAGSITPTPPTGGFSRVTVSLTSSGGGGANSSTNGTTGGNNSFVFTLDGIVYTIRATGGGGGSTSNAGGAAGQILYAEGGGAFTTTIPASLAANTKFSIVSTRTGNPGSSGAGFTPGPNLTIPGGTITGATISPTTPGTGGPGTSSFISNVVVQPAVIITTNTTFSLPANVTAVTMTVTGAGGGDGYRETNEGKAGCAANIIGGTGGSGARVTASINFASLGSGSFSTVIGRAGNKGGNLSAGSSLDTAGSPAGGNGAGAGGSGGRGAWGNGGSGGGGGGSTGLFFAGTPILGAGGGGGGGGSGGGNNGGSITDTCSTGGPGQLGSSFVVAGFAAMDFGVGSAAGTAGCTAGGGGGGGGGAGTATSGGARGGEGGPAGLGHSSSGGNGGAGGFIGRSAYNLNRIIGTPSLSQAGNANSDGSVSYTATVDESFYGSVGGGGGSGATINFRISGLNLQNNLIPGTLTLGAAGGGYSSGVLGSSRVVYFQTQGGDSETVGTSVAVGRYYDCDASGVPTSVFVNTPLFYTSSPDQVDVFSPGNGTGTDGGFTIPTGTTNPSWGGKVTRYIKFAGTGSRELIFDELDLSAVNSIKFSVRVGNNSNGGEAPNGNLELYYRLQNSTTVTFYDIVTSSTVSSSGWVEYTVNISPTSTLRSSGTTLVLRQPRLSTNTANTDTYGLSSVTMFYDPQEVTEFVSAGGAFLPGNSNNTGSDTGIDEVRRTISAIRSGISVSDGIFTLSSSTPISTTATATPRNPIPLVTRYHRVKYLIKAF
jgi:hypothetical protein